ncbi:hypothetical protein BDF20DRAFT_913628 [Mycotypha africana]|uniref:uncharacterized protein n=1 Tax=Mycotypha africana TaxID=64632 RepID=UPI002301EA84|nr:uncharacterized protein BDF20DRAFT_913628 [Mycotypha africana]KAI8977284.1 hypothetical protein BDF20DRAFT_913628 [Mycotypha africana]
MSIFGLLNAKKKSCSDTLALRKTHSTGDIEDSKPVLNTNAASRNRKITIQRPSSLSPNNNPNESTISSILITSSSYVGDQTTLLSQISQQQQTDQKMRSSQNKTLPPVLEDRSLKKNDQPSVRTHHKNNIKNKDADAIASSQQLADRLRDITADDMDLLLALETQARMDYQEEKDQLQREREGSEQSNESSNSSGRPSRLRFDLPATPTVRSPDQNNDTSTRGNGIEGSDQQEDPTSSSNNRRWSLPDIPLLHQQQRQNRISRWGRSIMFRRQSEEVEEDGEEEGCGSSLFNNMGSAILLKTKSNTSNASNNSSNSSSSQSCNTKKKRQKKKQNNEVVLGCRVQLYKRPLPIIGTVKYRGAVHFDSTGEEWLGIELDGRVGNTDGKVDGIRYFQSNSNCGIFVRKEDTRKVA